MKTYTIKYKMGNLDGGKVFQKIRLTDDIQSYVKELSQQVRDFGFNIFILNIEVK